MPYSSLDRIDVHFFCCLSLHSHSTKIKNTFVSDDVSSMCVRVCVCVRERACVRARAYLRVCVCVCPCVHVPMRVCENEKAGWENRYEK